MRTICTIYSFIICTFILINLSSMDTNANPNFSRKYKVDCSTCHTIPPQLNRVGIEFRRLGYRFPNDLKEESPQPEQTYKQSEFPQSKEAITAMNNAGCNSCHATEPGSNGMTLQGVGARRSADDIRSFIKSDKHPGSSAAEELSASDLDLVVNYLASLKEAKTDKKSPWDYDFANYISTRGRTRFSWQKVTNQADRNQFFFSDMTFYYLGPVNRYLTAFFETEFGEGFDPNVLAQGTVLIGNPNLYAYLKVGNMRFVRQGVGALDRPKTISTDIAVSSRSHLFALNEDQRGAELSVGFNGNRTLLRAFITNGLDSLGNGRPIGRQDINTQKDFCFMLENLFGDKTATSVALLYYHGMTPIRTGNIEFYRLGAFGTLALNDSHNFEDIRLNGGVLYGSDNIPGAEPGDKNLGFLVGLDKKLGYEFYVSTRFDYFRPTERAGNNIVRSYTASVIKQVLTYLRLTLEYQFFQRPRNIEDQRLTGEFYLFF